MNRKQDFITTPLNYTRTPRTYDEARWGDQFALPKKEPHSVAYQIAFWCVTAVGLIVSLASATGVL